MSEAAGDDGARRVVLRAAGDQGAPAPGASFLGLMFFLASLTMLFGASVVAYVIVRSRARVWPPTDAPDLPMGLWLSTALLVACSAAAQAALHRIRRGDVPGMSRSLVWTLVCAIGFVAAQVWNWLGFLRLDTTFDWHLYGFTFYMLTGLHALHVAGGLIAVVVVLIRARLGHYTWAYYPGVRHTAIYWHYLGGIWLILLGLLWIDR